MKYLIILIAALLASGCATTDYEAYAKSASDASVARSQALERIAQSGDSSAKVAAVMALALGAGEVKLQAPAPNSALQWASILVPGIVQIYGITENSRVATTQSNNAASVANSTNAAFVGIAGKIQAAAANISTVTTTTDRNDVTTTSYANPTTTTTLSGTGTLGSGAYSTTANPTSTVLSGTGTLGSGAYSTTDTHAVTNSTPVITPVVQVVPTVITPVNVAPVVQITPVVVAP